jgi:hypothetical protein
VSCSYESNAAIAESSRSLIKAAPLRGAAARPPPGSALGRPPGTGAPTPASTPADQPHSFRHRQCCNEAIFLGFHCPARRHRV